MSRSSGRPRLQAGYPLESGTMRLLRRLGMNRLAWVLRRAHCPVQNDALVLEARSGGDPCRNRRLGLAILLRCPGRIHESMETTRDEIRCTACDARYDVRDGVQVMFPPGTRQPVAAS